MHRAIKISPAAQPDHHNLARHLLLVLQSKHTIIMEKLGYYPVEVSLSSTVTITWKDSLPLLTQAEAVTAQLKTTMPK